MRLSFKRARVPAPQEPETEQRSLTSWMGGLSGYNVMDPAAIPPPGVGVNRNWAGVNVNERTILQADAVMTSLRIISNGMMELGNPVAYTETLSDDNYPYRLRLAQQPKLLSNTFGMAPTGNIEQPQYIGIEQTVVSMALWGESWWYVIDRDRLGYATAIEVLLPAILYRKEANDGSVEWVYGQGANNQVTLDPANLIHIPHKILPAAPRGLSSLDYAGISVAISLAAMEYGARWFSQGMSPGYTLVAPGKLGKDEVERIVQTMMIQHGGLTQAHLPMLMDQGIEPKKNQATPDEAQYLETLEYCRSVVASYFGIPATLLGNALQKLAPQPAHTVGEEMQRMVTWTLSGYINPLEQVYAALLSSGTQVAFERTRILQSDAQSFATLITALKNMNVYTPNELRSRYFGEAPLPGGDDLITPLASNTAPEQTDTSSDPVPTNN